MFNSKGGVSPFYYCHSDNKIVLSTAIYLFPREIKEKLSFSTAHILEYALFNYPLGENTLFNEVYNLLPGECVAYTGNTLRKNRYFDIGDLLTDKRISKKDAVERGDVIFANVVNTLSDDCKKISASLTGGFDGRAILSTLRFNMSDVLLYSFGV